MAELPDNPANADTGSPTIWPASEAVDANGDGTIAEERRSSTAVSLSNSAASETNDTAAVGHHSSVELATQQQQPVSVTPSLPAAAGTVASQPATTTLTSPQQQAAAPAAAQAAGKRPRRQRQHGTAAALRLAYTLACCTGWICLGIIAWDLIVSFTMSGITESNTKTTIKKAWYEVALCFGPRMTRQTLTELLPEAPPETLRAVDDGPSYSRLFTQTFNWTRNGTLFPLMSDPVQQFLPLFLNTSWAETDGLQREHTDMTMLYSYAICRNYSFTGPIQKNKTTLHFTVSLDNYTQEAIFNISSHADIYLYPSGEFSEFGVISDSVPYRHDFETFKSLYLIAEKTNRISHKHRPCVEIGIIGNASNNAPIGRQANCMHWCMARTLLRNTECAMPFMMGFVYNMTRVVSRSTVGKYIGNQSVFFRSDRRPYMGEFAKKKLCDTEKEFNVTFELFRKMYLWSSRPAHHLTQQCRQQCPFDCRSYSVEFLTSGDVFRHKNATMSLEHRLELHIPTTMKVIAEETEYRTEAMMNHMMGLLAFMFTTSLFGLHDLVFACVDLVLRKLGVVQSGPRPVHKDEHAADERDPQDTSPAVAADAGAAGEAAATADTGEPPAKRASTANPAPSAQTVLHQP